MLIKRGRNLWLTFKYCFEFITRIFPNKNNQIKIKADVSTQKAGMQKEEELRRNHGITGYLVCLLELMCTSDHVRIITAGLVNFQSIAHLRTPRNATTLTNDAPAMELIGPLAFLLKSFLT